MDSTLPASALPRSTVSGVEGIVVASPDLAWIGRTLALGRRSTLGRSPDADRTFVDQRMSRVHAALGGGAVEDLQSRNGVFVDGRPVSGRVPLRAGAVLRVGDTCFVVAPAGVDEGSGPLIGRSAALGAVRRSLERVARTDLSVLVTGETGTGKEVVAAELHRHSGRSGAFVPVNCAAIAPTLAESTLFGHVRGAFTGATTARDGLFVEAEKGTLFLDEIGELEPGLQAKLLRVLEDGRVTPLGGGSSRRVDVRVVAATNRAVREAGEGLRPDLVARLDEWPLALPPLRDRREDIALLLDHFAPGRVVAADAVEALLLHDWPANVRELRNVARRLGLAGERVTLEALPTALAGRFVARRAGRDAAPAAAAAPDSLPAAASLTREEAVSALRACGGNVSRAARKLSIGRKTLYRRIADWEIDVGALRPGGS